MHSQKNIKLAIMVFSFFDYPPEGGRKRSKYVGVWSHVCVLLYLITVELFQYTYLVTWRTARDFDNFKTS
jgi:hypothetical protein